MLLLSLPLQLPPSSAMMQSFIERCAIKIHQHPTVWLQMTSPGARRQRSYPGVYFGLVFVQSEEAETRRPSVFVSMVHTCLSCLFVDQRTLMNRVYIYVQAFRLVTRPESVGIDCSPPCNPSERSAQHPTCSESDCFSFHSE